MYCNTINNIMEWKKSVLRCKREYLNKYKCQPENTFFSILLFMYIISYLKCRL